MNADVMGSVAQKNAVEGDELNAVGNEMLNIGKADTSPVPLEPIGNMTKSESIPTNAFNGRVLPLEVMFDVPINLVFEVGRSNITIEQLMELKEGSFIELNQVSVDTIEVRINDKIIAQGETIAIQQHYGIRFGELARYSSLENEAIDVSS